MLPAAVVVKDASYFKVFKLESADNAAVTGAIFEHTDTYKQQLSLRACYAFLPSRISHNYS